MHRDPIGPGQESVWDYPRPPRVVADARRVRIEFEGKPIAESTRALRLLETSHPPTWYVPITDVIAGVWVPNLRSSNCEFKGRARYFDLVVGERRSIDAGWFYPEPTPAFAQLRDHLCFYASRVDAAWVDEVRVVPQAGLFYGGWITPDVVGPFKGAPGTSGW
ncbi:DUF427 domain-containing protein [Nannocystaceae bacterium ST9]